MQRARMSDSNTQVPLRGGSSAISSSSVLDDLRKRVDVLRHQCDGELSSLVPKEGWDLRLFRGLGACESGDAINRCDSVLREIRELAGRLGHAEKAIKADILAMRMAAQEANALANRQREAREQANQLRQKAGSLQDMLREIRSGQSCEITADAQLAPQEMPPVVTASSMIEDSDSPSGRTRVKVRRVLGKK